MELIRAYGIINRSLKEVSDSMISLTVFDVDTKVSQVRLKTASINIAERAERVAGAITAHRLNQYTNKFYSVRLKDVEACPLDVLLNLEFDATKLQAFRRSYDS